MRNHGYQNYFDNEVLAASPIEADPNALWRCAGFDCGGAPSYSAPETFARGHVRSTRAIADSERAIQLFEPRSRRRPKPEPGRPVWICRRLLIEANTKQIEAPLAEAEGLLSTLAEAGRLVPRQCPSRVS